MSKRKRNLIIVGSIVGVLVDLAIIFGSLFGLRTITVDYLTTTFRVEEYSKEDIIRASSIKKGKNIIFQEFDNNKQKLEKEFPYAEFKIMRVFPNTVIIYVYERVPVFRYLKNGFWYIFDENLKCLEIVANANLNLNNNNDIPILNVDEGLNIDCEVGEFLDNKNLKNTITNIIDGVYGFEETPISVVSDITLSNDDIFGTQVISLKITDSGTIINVQGENLLVEKIAYATYLYVSVVSQNPEYNGKLDKISITVYKDFNLENKKVVVNEGN